MTDLTPQVPENRHPSEVKFTPIVIGTHIIQAEDGMPTGFRFSFNYGGAITTISFDGFHGARAVVSCSQWLRLCVSPGGGTIVSLIISNGDETSIIAATPDTTRVSCSSYGAHRLFRCLSSASKQKP